MLKRIAMVAMFAVGLASSAGAATVTYVFSGVVGFSSDPLAIGSPMTATFVIELATPGASGTAYLTDYNNAVISASVSIGSLNGSGSGGSGSFIRIQDDDPVLGDFFQMNIGYVNGTFNGSAFAMFQVDLQMGAVNPSAITSQALQIPSDPSQFVSPYLSISFGSGNSSQVFNGVVDSIQLVPEPSLAALLGAGVLALAMRRRT